MFVDHHFFKYSIKSSNKIWLYILTITWLFSTKSLFFKAGTSQMNSSIPLPPQKAWITGKVSLVYYHSGFQWFCPIHLCAIILIQTWWKYHTEVTNIPGIPFLSNKSHHAYPFSAIIVTGSWWEVPFPVIVSSTREIAILCSILSLGNTSVCTNCLAMYYHWECPVSGGYFYQIECYG